MFNLMKSAQDEATANRTKQFNQAFKSLFTLVENQLHPNTTGWNLGVPGTGYTVGQWYDIGKGAIQGAGQGA